MAKQKSTSKEKRRKVIKKQASRAERVPGMARDATTVRTPTPGAAGSSNMMDRVLPTRHRVVRLVERVVGAARQRTRGRKSANRRKE